MEKLSRLRNAGIVAVSGLALLVGSAGLPGCATTPEYEQRIMAVKKNPNFNPEFSKELESAVKFYNSVDPNNLTSEQKEKLEKFNKYGARKYSKEISNFSWMNKDNLTDRDKIYAVVNYELTESFGDSMRELLSP